MQNGLDAILNREIGQDGIRGLGRDLLERRREGGWDNWEEAWSSAVTHLSKDVK